MRRALLVAITMSLALSVFAGPFLVGVSGDPTSALSVNSGQALAVGWNQTIDFSGVQIRANLYDETYGFAGFTAYLNHLLGTGADYMEVARYDAAAGSYNGWVLLFENLDLSAGYYYLIIAPVFDGNGNSDTQMSWNTTDNPTLLETPPTVLLGDGSGIQWWNVDALDTTYPPVTAFGPSDPTNDGYLLWDMSTPEPSTLLLGLIGLPVLVVLRRRRRAA